MKFALTPPPAASGFMAPARPTRNALAPRSGTRGIPLDVTSNLRAMGVNVAKIPEVVLAEVAKLSTDELERLVEINRNMPSNNDDDVSGYVLF